MTGFLLHPRDEVRTGGRLGPGTPMSLLAPPESAEQLSAQLAVAGFPVAAVTIEAAVQPLAEEEYCLDIDAESATVRVAHGRLGWRHLRRTLAVLLAEPAGLAATVIRDRPAVPVRGVIEGYYGAPWSHQRRLRQLEAIADLGMNAYFLSPKDDPYLRERWREPYPEDRMGRLGELVEHARQQDVELIFGVSPGLDIVASNPADITALIAKLRAGYEVGVRTFVVPFDDIDPDAQHGTDLEAFGDDIDPAAAAQAHVLNSVRDAVSSWPGCAPVQLVPTDYFQAGENDYRARLRDLLHPQVQVHWTGVGICAPTVTAADLRAARERYGHEIVLWDNYPVNDYLARSLVLGPYLGREPAAAAELPAIFANAMPEALASHIGFATVAAWGWNPHAAGPEQTWRSAVLHVGRENAEALQVLAELCYGSPMAGRQAPILEPLRRLVDAVAGADEAETRRAAPVVAALGRRLAWSADTLTGGSTAELAEEIAGWIDAMATAADSLDRAARSALAGSPFGFDPTTRRHEVAVGVLAPLLAELARHRP